MRVKVLFGLNILVLVLARRSVKGSKETGLFGRVTASFDLHTLLRGTIVNRTKYC